TSTADGRSRENHRKGTNLAVTAADRGVPVTPRNERRDWRRRVGAARRPERGARAPWWCGGRGEGWGGLPRRGRTRAGVPKGERPGGVMRNWARKSIGALALSALLGCFAGAAAAGALSPPPGEGQPASPGTCVFAFTPVAADGGIEPGSVTVRVTQLP